MNYTVQDFYVLLLKNTQLSAPTDRPTNRLRLRNTVLELTFFRLTTKYLQVSTQHTHNLFCNLILLTLTEPCLAFINQCVQSILHLKQRT